MWKKLCNSNFIKSVAILMSGTIIAQIITILIAPVLTRLYTPDDFGVLAVLMSIVSIISVIVTWRYELAIVLPKKDDEAINLLALSIIITAFMSIVITIGILLFRMFFDLSRFNLNSTDWLWIIPLSTLLVGLYQSFSYFSTREKQFKRLSVANVSRSISVNGIQLTGGILKYNYFGLLIGYLFGQIVATVVLITQAFTNIRNISFKTIRYQTILHLFKKYKDFPLFSAPQALINSVSQNILPIYLTTFYGTAAAGLYAVSLKLLQMPVNLVGNAFRQVFYQKASDSINKELDIRPLFLKSTLLLLSLAIIPFILLCLFAPLIFAVFLGDNWFEAGYFARWMSIWLLFVFISRPTVVLFQILRLQKNFLYFESVGTTIRLLILTISSLLYDVITTIALYSIFNAIYYLILFAYIFKKLNKN